MPATTSGVENPSSGDFRNRNQVAVTVVEASFPPSDGELRVQHMALHILSTQPFLSLGCFDNTLVTLLNQPWDHS